MLSAWSSDRAGTQVTQMARALDHLVLPTASLETARARLGALGFTVAPEGVHPFGTVNACVFFADGTFLEPLAVGDRAVTEAETRRGNVFVARDAAFRFRNGEEGCSAVVFASSNANADHAGFAGSGLSIGGQLDFSRAFKTSEGEEGEASFRLAFAGDWRSPDCFFFTCERINVPKVDRTTLETHANGVTAIREVILREAEPDAFSDFLETLCDVKPVVDGTGMAVDLRQHRLTVLPPAELSRRFGIKAGHGRGLRPVAISFAAKDLAAVAALLDARGLAFERHENRLVVQPEAGQGTAFMFEEA